MATQASIDANPRIGSSHDLPGGEERPVPRLFINGRFLVQQATGVQRAAREVTVALDRLLGRGAVDADVTLLAPPGPWVQRLSLDYIKVETVGRFGGVLWEQFDLPGYARGGTLLCLGNSAPARSLTERDTDVVVMVHDVSFLDHPGAYKLTYRIGHRMMLPLLMRAARAIVTVSETERERLVRLAPAAAPRISVAPNGGWSTDIAASTGEVEGLPPPGYGLYVGSLSHRKNFARTLEAAIRLAREDGLHFVFVGATGRVLRQPRCDVPDDVADRIHFLGQVNDAASLARIYRDARFLLFPSLYEACPLPPVEAAHFGCPVVVSNIPSMWERCGRGVIYCDPLSVDSMLRGVRTVLADSAWRDRAIAAGQAMARRRCWQDQAALVCVAALGEDCLANRASGGGATVAAAGPCGSVAVSV
ncbi:glycosyltransferase family 1 protein [Novosphingobium sp. fls2-241-R2A-195]|uniref:glycosyltransferase family 4 protein n=1 Tax=Novosphingobium sp. fls2-241-R2A-195 TaxID=3040296 RepID=UPI0025503228|nr:glycosyltransferase family 1 protein [Novosphingobium sp. fls2-241-R2A-195]